MKQLNIISLIVLMVLSSCNTLNKENMVQREISDAWIYSEIEGSHKGKATVPGTIHTDLLNNNQIEDPFYRVNEKDLQWVDKKDWKYETIFQVSDEELGKDNITLSLEGLDTYADVYVNDSLVLKANNMFRIWELDVKGLLVENDNKLTVYFHSPIKKGLEILEAADYTYPAINDQSENGGMGDKKVSIFTRKAGYHYGWDWGPRFVTSGIWRPIILNTWDKARIKDVFIKQPEVNEKLAKLKGEVVIESNKSFEATVILKNTATDKTLVSKNANIKPGSNNVYLPFKIENPQLWWSNGLGEAHLYQFSIEVYKGKNLIHTHLVSTGIRSVKLVREADEFGESFVFELNGIRVFAKGANYIPNDSFLPRVKSSDYIKVIKDAVDANMNMLRVWGGGIYENDEFYDLCDKNGLLVWQDFMFACSMYPGDDAFLENVQQEAIDNVIRLRNHPSIALWCGNNEINAAWNHYSEGGWGWKELYTEAQQEEIQKAYLDLFHGVLPDVVKQYTDGDDYWPSSPQAGPEPQQHAGYENTSGDMHYWGVWHGKHPFKDFDKYKARFMSEYGFQSFPDFETVKKYALPEDYDIESDVMAAHQRSGIGNLRIKEYMGWDYNTPNDFQQFLYMSQILQARGVKMAIEAHRRAMPYCMGTLYWQLNDCWPVASWSSTDYYHKWKALHYAVKRAYEPLIISSYLKHNELDIYVVSDLLESIDGDLEFAVIDFEGNELSKKSINITVGANTSSFAKSILIDDIIGDKSKSEVVLIVSLIQGNHVLATNKFYLVKPKEMNLPQVEISTAIVNNNGNRMLEISANKLAKDVYLNIPDQEVFFSDNYFDLLPGQKRVIDISGTGDFSIDKLELVHLQQVQ